MKYYIVVVILIGGCHALNLPYLKQIKKMISEKVTNCEEKLHASKVDIDEIKHSIVPTSHTGKCVYSCVQKELGIQDSDGKLNSENIRQIFAELKVVDEDIHAAVVPVVEKCLSEVPNDSDECIVAVNFSLCLQDGTLAEGLCMTL